MFVRKKRPAPARRGKAKAKGRGKAKAKPARGGLPLVGGLEQRHLDLIGLFLVAAGIYLIFVLFAGWEGGKVGYGIETGLVYLFGSVGARIFTLLMLLSGGMILTGTSVSALLRGIGRGLRIAFGHADEASRTVARTHADWREDRRARSASEAETRAGRDRRDGLPTPRTTRTSSRPWRWPRRTTRRSRPESQPGRGPRTPRRKKRMRPR